MYSEIFLHKLYFETVEDLDEMVHLYTGCKNKLVNQIFFVVQHYLIFTDYSVLKIRLFN